MEVNSYVGSALIDMYGKCGDLISARRVFDSMPNKDVVTWNAFITGVLESMPHKNEVSWNAMISALAFHGQAQEALSLFRRMSNDITFIGVLSACVHAGLVDEGRQLTSVRSLGLIKKMPGKPDEIVLGSLLGACQRCRNADVGERVIQLFLETKQSNSGNYVISSKIHANMKRWDDCAKMRVLMRQCGVSKTPGCSWIDIGARVHEFHAGDSLQHHSVIIYQLLNEEMKRAGCIPNTDCI
ncbi:hypothetical protein OIU78_023698 [Salix suchowensis]|nr:hypothetical protein OIU78_023698 [Salix suchowensis]